MSPYTFPKTGEKQLLGIFPNAISLRRSKYDKARCKNTTKKFRQNTCTIFIYTGTLYASGILIQLLLNIPLATLPSTVPTLSRTSSEVYREIQSLIRGGYLKNKSIYKAPKSHIQAVTPILRLYIF